MSAVLARVRPRAWRVRVRVRVSDRVRVGLGGVRGGVCGVERVMVEMMVKFAMCNGHV